MPRAAVTANSYWRDSRPRHCSRADIPAWRPQKYKTSNGSWCIGIKGEMSGTVCVTFTWDIYIYMSCLQLLFVLLFVHYCNVMVYVVYCVASGKQEKVQACFVTLWLFIISCHSLYKTTLGSLCSRKPAWSLKKRPHSMCLKPFVKMCIFVVIQIFWSLRKYKEQ